MIHLSAAAQSHTVYIYTGLLEGFLALGTPAQDVYTGLTLSLLGQRYRERLGFILPYFILPARSINQAEDIK